MIYVVATFLIRPGALESFVGAAYVLIDAARREPGCLYYNLHASVTDPDRMLCYEQWGDRAAFDLHFAAPYMATFVAATADFVLSSRVEIIHPEHIDTL